MRKKLRQKFQISVKSRITLWFTAFIIVIVILALFFIFRLSNQMMESDIKEDLIETVDNKKTEEKMEEHKHDIREESDIPTNHSITTAVFDHEGNLLDGTIPDSVSEIGFLPRKVRSYTVSGSRYFIYDQQCISRKLGNVWIRGYACIDSLHSASSTQMKLLFLFFPLLIFIAAKTGYFITSKALDPVVKITRTANAVSGNNDLSTRIDLTDIENPNNEFYILGNTFNQMFERLEKSSLKERQFTSDASHELRTPTAIILAQADYLASLPADEIQKKAIDSILRQSRRMSSLISDLLLFARADNNRQTLVLEPFDFSELAEMVAEELSLTAKEKNISITTAIQKELVINGDQTMLMRMLINLVSNAIQYGTPKGSIQIAVSRCPTGITGYVKDDGIGITEEQLPKIWDRFYQADPSRKHENGSSGLGLSMVQWIVEAHHGSITVESEAGKGSTFSFWLPES